MSNIKRKVLILVCLLAIIAVPAGCMRKENYKDENTKYFKSHILDEYRSIKSVYFSKYGPKFLVEYNVRNDFSEEDFNEVFLETREFLLDKFAVVKFENIASSDEVVDVSALPVFEIHFNSPNYKVMFTGSGKAGADYDLYKTWILIDTETGKEIETLHEYEWDKAAMFENKKFW